MTNKSLVNRIDHLEVTCKNISEMEGLYKRLGFTCTQAKETENGVQRMLVQGKTKFLLSSFNNGFAKDYQDNHGDGVCRISFHVDDVEATLKTALDRGAELIESYKKESDDSVTIETAAIKGFGDVRMCFFKRSGDGVAAFDVDSAFAPGFKSTGQSKDLNSNGLLTIDHLTNNVEKGKMQHWCDFYEKIFGFEEVRHFNIQGASTGLLSKVMQSKDGAVKIPINEPKDDKSQIQEYIDEHKGAGVQHIALTTVDIVGSVEKLKTNDFKFLDVPETYYEDLPSRINNINEPLSELQRLQILADGDNNSYLLQIFTENQIGPLFFEIIERHGHNGFGEGNFKALFEAIERDQRKRGVL